MEIRTVAFSRAVYKPDDFPRDDRPQFAFVGRSNVGKSSLINKILNRKGVARVSQTPGKTQAVQYYLINERFYLVDLPGYGYAKVSRSVSAEWGELIRSYLELSPQLRELFLLVDSRRTPSDHDLDMRDWMAERDVPWKVVMTKIDKLSKNQLAVSRRTIGEALDLPIAEMINFSTMTRTGVDDLWKEIRTRLTAG